MTAHHDTVHAYWKAAEARDWERFAATLSPDVVYEMAQTRERVHGREAYVRFNRGYPGDWHAVVRRVVADDDGAVSLADFTVGDEQITGISFFTFDDQGLITRIDDVWPEPYEPPAGRAHLTERF